ncbi:hypothetical protein HMPREF0542_11625 [Ligilactobacillus ruminis ATCC 25644]|uniref:Uncharacterized protein n=1 Tax=Ligilactobacillus ruminis ATCC 25644 TaxID=525362 RepID=E7FRU8_9LACO|nr:hypothetical protein HMPREF0542_11625 [Ligilactobacillus ruminis ATCC 25644]
MKKGKETRSFNAGLSVNLSEILDKSVEQYFCLKKQFLCIENQKAERSQSQLDRLCSAFHLIK